MSPRTAQKSMVRATEEGERRWFFGGGLHIWKATAAGDRWRVPPLRGPDGPWQGHAAAPPLRLRRDDDRAGGRDPDAPRWERAHRGCRWHRQRRREVSLTPSRSRAPTALGCCACTPLGAARRSTGTPANPSRGMTVGASMLGRWTWAACRPRPRRTEASRSSVRLRSARSLRPDFVGAKAAPSESTCCRAARAVVSAGATRKSQSHRARRCARALPSETHWRREQNVPLDASPTRRMGSPSTGGGIGRE